MHNTTPSFDELALDKQEWLESLDCIYREYGDTGVREILRAVQNHALNSGIRINEPRKIS